MAKLGTILEMIKKERVVRGGNWKTKYSSTKKGYKIKNKDGQRTEVKMSTSEIKKRKRAARKAAKKNKGKAAQIAAKRRRSMAKR
ncbi:MAG: hypothetical protein DRJ01_00340 [Bacteroidetes bacterium]|nr:MAG: hypothetical protein DRJ01_00340 [Bacteroidota bacterium]